jgi:hypothetical protein
MRVVNSMPNDIVDARVRAHIRSQVQQEHDNNKHAID